jgi:hypothetical protein
VLAVGGEFVVRVLAERQHALAVGQDVRDAEARDLAALEAPRTLRSA